jgi:glucose/arabinose dehydrogenase
MVQLRKLDRVLFFAVGLAALADAAAAQTFEVAGSAGTRVKAEPLAEFNEPWAMAFLPDGRMLVTEKSGTLLLVSADGTNSEVARVPQVAYGGQGGLGDIVLHPGFAQNGLVYLSFAEPGEGNTRGAAVARARLVLTGEPKLEELSVIWRQVPKTSGAGHYGHRIAFAPDGKLFISSGDRQISETAQEMSYNLGKIIRLNDDGSTPDGNPFVGKGEIESTIWTLGHRNTLALAFDASGRLWNHEMGPAGGDELNIVEPGKNYGWPIVSQGDHYDGTPIPRHETRPEFAAPQVFWNPVIAPAGMIIHSGRMFPQWQGNAILAGLRSEGLVRVELAPQADGRQAREVERIDFGRRIREVEEAPDGAILILEDRDGGRLVRLTPVGQ